MNQNDPVASQPGVGSNSPSSTTCDFRALFHAAPDLYLVLAPDFSIVDASDAYLKATMTNRSEIVGRSIFEVFPDDPNDASANGVANLRASLNRVLIDKRPHAMAVQRYPIRRPKSEGGHFEERHWSPVNTPVLNDAGQVAFIIHRVADVSELVRLKREKLEQQQTLDEVSARSERYSRLLDTAPDAIVTVGEDGRIQLVNVKTEALFGYSREELMGRPLDVLIPERFRRAHVRHMSAYFANPGSRPMGSGLELYGRCKDASEIPIEVSLSPHLGENGMTVSAAIRDISERRRLEAAARLVADRLKSAVDSIEDAFALFDADDRLVLCNSVFRRLIHDSTLGTLVGKQYSEILEAWINDIDFPDEAARARHRQERLARHRQEQTSTFHVRLRDGRSLRVTDRRTPEGGVVKTIWDVTEDERRANELREARAAAEAASAAKSEFLSSMSHELRTPLNAILGFAQLLELDKRLPLADRHRERVQQITKGGEHLLRLIDEVLDLSRIESGTISISTEPVDVAEVLDEATRTLHPIAAQQGIALDVEPPAANAPRVHVDRMRFAQILMNFGSNAIKYNRPQGRVKFSVTVVPAGIRVMVMDTGMGIPLDQQHKLFQPFQRAGQETGPIEGTGIGLVITKRLAELMSGSVGFRSVRGEGSTFWVEVPTVSETAVALPDNDERTSSLAQARPISPEGRPHLVLYVEDNPANVTFMRDLMSTVDDVDLLTVPSAELGVDVARARLPEIIVMDINLPGMSGLDALRALRAIPETKNIPVVALTAAASERDKQRGMQAGFYRYMTKPVKVAEFVTVIEELLAARRT